MAKIIGASLSELHEFLKLDVETLESKKAKLFPQPKMKSERVTTDVFLASLSAVKEYREHLLNEISARKITKRNVSIHVYTEISNEDGSARPDGLIVLASGRNNPTIEWACFVETKVGSAMIEQAQMEAYIEFAKELDIPAIISISNQITAEPTIIPYSTRKKKIELYHWSWAYLKVMSTKLLQDEDGIEDEDHKYILSELRRFFEGNDDVSNMKDMGREWKTSAQAVNESAEGKIPKDALAVVCKAYAQEEMDIGLQLTDRTTSNVHLLLKRDEVREDSIYDQILGKNKTVVSTYYLEDDKNFKFTLEMDFNKKAVTYRCLVSIDSGKAQAQTTKLLKRLDPSGKSDEIQVVAVYKQNKRSKSVSLAQLFEEKDAKPSRQYSIVDKDKGDEVKYFDIFVRQEFLRDFTNPKNFILKLEQGAESFLNQVVIYT
ncbi:MAG: hypothetical protein COA44_13145 [Arcobacter sp.]|nr:MAG: hypothetical protein COA44_13145 [Arcobacter sp.]